MTLAERVMVMEAIAAVFCFAVIGFLMGVAL